MGFPITTGTIIVIIDYDWVYYFLYFFIYFFCISPHLVGREQAVLVASFLYLGF